MKRSLAEVITKAIDVRQAELRVCMPGTVIAYYAATQTADIQPPIWSAIDLEDGTLQEQLPVLFNVPVEFPRGGGFVLMFPLVPGDTGVLEFSDFSMDLWRSSGLDGAPQDLRTHALGSAVFRPGLSCSLVPIAGAPATTADGLAIGAELGQRIQITQNAIALGGPTATDFVALASKVESRLGAIESALSTWIGPTGTLGVLVSAINAPGVGNPVVSVLTPAAAFTPAASPVASTVVKSV